jgi:hypothetical protein
MGLGRRLPRLWEAKKILQRPRVKARLSGPMLSQGDSAAKAGGSAESGDGPKNSTKAKGSAKNKDTEEKAKAGAQSQKKASTVKESDSKGTKDQGSQQRPKSGPGQGDQSERFQQDLGEFFKGMEEVGKTLAKGIESTVNEIQRNLGLGAMPNPFGVPGKWPFFTIKKRGMRSANRSGTSRYPCSSLWLFGVY